jgi:predicted ATPase
MPYANLYKPELLRIEGNLLAILGEFNEAEAKLMQALQLAHEQEAKSNELRAAISLSKFWRARRQTTKARKLLARIYGCFSEGFETADLKEAKALLTKMSMKAHAV